MGIHENLLEGYVEIINAMKEMLFLLVFNYTAMYNNNRISDVSTEF
jgi:hypothetical protein